MTDDENPTTEPKPTALWQNDDWAVTDYGLESRITAGDPPHRVNYDIKKEDLVKTWPSTAGVANATVQIASKSWHRDPDRLLEAYEMSLQIHHPGQTKIDLAATREATLSALRRTSRAQSVGSDDGSVALDYLALPRQRPLTPTPTPVVADPSVTGVRPPVSRQRPPDDDAGWIEAFPSRFHEALRRHGVPPRLHPRAPDYDLEVIDLVLAGLSGDALARAARHAFGQRFGEDDEFYDADEPTFPIED